MKGLYVQVGWCHEVFLSGCFFRDEILKFWPRSEFSENNKKGKIENLLYSYWLGNTLYTSFTCISLDVRWFISDFVWFNAFVEFGKEALQDDISVMFYSSGPREQLYVLCWRQEWWTLLKRLEVVCNINEVFIRDVQYRLLCEWWSTSFAQFYKYDAIRIRND